MLGSAGVVVLDESVNMAWAAEKQLQFFEEESCGQCAPCRIGTQVLRRVINDAIAGKKAPEELIADVAWQMAEGSICGRGQSAFLPLTTALKYFPDDFAAAENVDG